MAAWLVEYVMDNGLRHTLKAVVSAGELGQVQAAVEKFVGLDDFERIDSVQRIAEAVLGPSGEEVPTYEVVRG